MEFLEQAADVALVVTDAELFFNDPGDAGAGPDFSPEAVSLCPVPKELGDQSFLGFGEFRRMAGSGSCPQGGGATFLGVSEPTAHGSLGNVQGLRNVALIPASLFQVQRPQPPPFTPVTRDKV